MTHLQLALGSGLWGPVHSRASQRHMGRPCRPHARSVATGHCVTHCRASNTQGVSRGPRAQSRKLWPTTQGQVRPRGHVGPGQAVECGQVSAPESLVLGPLSGERLALGTGDSGRSLSGRLQRCHQPLHLGGPLVPGVQATAPEMTAHEALRPRQGPREGATLGSRGPASSRVLIRRRQEGHRGTRLRCWL